MIIAQGVMVCAAGVCVAGAVRMRSLVPILTSIVMLLLMIDHAALQSVPAPLSAFTLLLCAIALAIELRLSHERHDGVSLNRQVASGSALAYLAMAWQVLDAGHHPDIVATPVEHHSTGLLTLHIAQLTLVVALCAWLVTLGVQSIQRKRVALAAESFGMAAMVVAMMLSGLI